MPEAPNSEILARTLISALDIAKEAHNAQREWEPALHCIDASLEIMRALERPAEDIAGGRMNRANALRMLGRFGEAGDIAKAVGFLASPAAAYITGETLHVNGGMYMP